MLLFRTDYFKSKQLKPGNLGSLSFSLFNHIIYSCSDPSKDHFTVVFLEAKPLIQSEAVVNLVVLEISIQLAIDNKVKFNFEKWQHFYHNKVTLTLTPIQRLGNQACNFKMDCDHARYNFSLQYQYNIKQTSDEIKAL